MEWLTFEVLNLEIWKYPILFLGMALFVMMLRSLYLILFEVMEEETKISDKPKSKRNKKNNKKEVIV